MGLSLKQFTSIWNFSLLILATVVKITAHSYHTDSGLVFTVHLPCSITTEGHCPTLSSVCFKFRRSQKVHLTRVLFSLRDENRDKNQLLFRVGLDEKGAIWLQSSITIKRQPTDLEITKNASFWHRFCLLTSSSATNLVDVMLNGAYQTINISKIDIPFNYYSVQDRRLLLKFPGKVRNIENETRFEGCFKDVKVEVQSKKQVRFLLSMNSTSNTVQEPFQKVCVTNETCRLSEMLPPEQSTINFNCDCAGMTETSTGIAGCPEVSPRGYVHTLWAVIVPVVFVLPLLMVSLACCVHIVRRSGRSQKSTKHSGMLANGSAAHTENGKSNGERNSVTCGSIAELEWDSQAENEVKNPELEWDPDAHNPKISDLCTADLGIETMCIEDEHTVISLEGDFCDISLKEGII